MAEGRSRGFVPTVLVGLGAAALTAVAAGQEWATASSLDAGVDVESAARGSSSAPLAVALALVALAAWGVVLVLRGRVRQAVAAVGALASAGVLVAVVTAFGRVQTDAGEAVLASGGTGDAVASSLTAWYFVCGAGAALTLAALAVAVVTSGTWPAMGSRYDAPATRASGGTATRPASEQDMWHALDDGRDPTA
ncbi:MAG TPA: Trp biosynthesis-associated membrane protein [Nocardioidaceae bacterium]|nr:Trp biosynthesis-associated membrane protein [Nocardioidaceae bacterium]